MQPNYRLVGANTRSSAHATDAPAGGRYVHCPYYIPESSPLATNEGAVGPRDSELRAYRPARIGSLGTPRVVGLWGQSPLTGVRGSYASVGSNNSHHRVSSYATDSSSDASPSSAVAYPAADLDNVVLLPTRPLLKALAKECRPSPPWCVGRVVPSVLADEVLLFHLFTAPMPEEEASRRSCTASMEAVLQQVWPGASLQPAGATAAGQNTTKGATLHFYATGTSDASQEQTQQWIQAANERGAQVNFIRDDRDLPCAVVVDSHSGHRCCIRYGDKAVAALAETSALLSVRVAANPVTRAVFNTLLALLNQNKILDDGGTARSMLSGEAVAIMLLAVVNSYDSSDVPDAGRVLLDFFLTFGFESYFNPIQSSVNVKGFGTPTAKKHPNAQLSVLDPVNEEVNVTAQVDRVSGIQAVFNYCYTALSQYAQVNSNLHRAQSALSTVIGGEPYWVRVLRYHQLHVEPYYSLIQLKRPLLVQYL
ncbi:hypothetical protein ABB37_02980 [Leptomonas pyrrhocoris]|uniref:PAP-associated domain-containing protein n=1 Tax=Leptomonas pyrrhocoris TaxID=157538 RepID=A0A0M9G661_LEPPY|nr:hypothetical protein ABB37_02980 [Leptomonas pyrrhocoris]KPA83320.1 hypothetical protein ABB37_02980 [Leptomonas pyrrhocoris]|eukprot:XP_015661759.1 hypothetical protein ABB37_02980 [Leptomonas pyrrhocoris]